MPRNQIEYLDEVEIRFYVLLGLGVQGNTVFLVVVKSRCSLDRVALQSALLGLKTCARNLA